ncbi:hypothetical protein IWX62_003147 [Arthrobacter sp. CAN_A1]
MSRKGTYLGNVSIGGSLSHLKEEWFRIQQTSTIEQFHTGLSESLLRWHSTRIQLGLGYLSPAEHLAQNPADE